MSRGVPNPGCASLSWGEMLEEWQKLWGRGERSFLMGLGWRERTVQRVRQRSGRHCGWAPGGIWGPNPAQEDPTGQGRKHTSHF